MSTLRDLARRATEFHRQEITERTVDAAQAVADLRLQPEWKEREIALANTILEFVAGQIERRALDGHTTAWIMDVRPDQYIVEESPPRVLPLQAVRAYLHGAARIVAEYLLAEDLSVLIRHKGNVDGVNHFQMETFWS